MFWVVIGDINPGGEVRAEGNIIILGKLLGKAHAGCKGARDCFVAALYMNPTQIIIADVVSYFQESDKIHIPEYAYIKDDHIFSKPLIKRQKHF